MTILTMVKGEAFDTAHDAALIKAGTHFYCQGHLGARPMEEQSPDPRYCRSCCDFLLQEADSTEGHSRKAAWVPKAGKAAAKSPAPIPQDGGGNMSTVAAIKAEKSPAPMLTIPIALLPPAIVDIIAPQERPKKRRGPKQKVLPVKMITQWAAKEEMGSKAIATRLSKERGIKVSYKTVQRILAGQRPLGL